MIQNFSQIIFFVLNQYRSYSPKEQRKTTRCIGSITTPLDPFLHNSTTKCYRIRQRIFIIPLKLIFIALQRYLGCDAVLQKSIKTIEYMQWNMTLIHNSGLALYVLYTLEVCIRLKLQCHIHFVQLIVNMAWFKIFIDQMLPVFDGSQCKYVL